MAEWGSPIARTHSTGWSMQSAVCDFSAVHSPRRMVFSQIATSSVRAVKGSYEEPAFAKTSFRRSVTLAAGFVRMFRSSSASMTKRPSRLFPTT